MARKSTINYAVTALFSVTARELVDHLAAFCSVKKLAWSPDVKIAMLKKPATNIEEAVWSVLNMQPSGHHSMLQSLLKPIKEHQLFDLSDWMRDLNGGQVPDYVQTYWSNNRVPKELDDLVKRALKAETRGDAEEETSILEKAQSDEEWLGQETATWKKQLKSRKASAPNRVMAAKGKGSKQGMKGEHPSVAAMQRIADGQEEIAAFLARGSTVATPKAKAELYRKLASRSMLAYNGNLARDDKARIVKGTPIVTIELFSPMKPDIQQELHEELKELFKNKAHVNVQPQQIEVVLRTRKANGETKTVRAKTTRVKAKSPAVRKAPAKLPRSKTPARKSVAKKDSAQDVFQFPTADNNPQTLTQDAHTSS